MFEPDQTPETTSQRDHLQRREGRFAALVAMLAAGACVRLRLVVAGEDAEDHRDVVLDRGGLEPARGLRADVVEVGGVAPDHRAEGHDGVSVAASRNPAGGQRKLERTGDTDNEDPVATQTEAGEGVEDGFEQPRHDGVIEPGRDDPDPRAGDVELGGGDVVACHG